MKKTRQVTYPFDRSVPGYPELSTWPKEPGFPEQILAICLYRDGGTVGISIKGKNGNTIELFFDRFLGRLCYGTHDTDQDAAYIKINSTFEKELYCYLESAKEKLNTNLFPVADIQLFNEYFERAKVYSGI